MPIRVTCPNCGKQFSAWDDLVGKTVQCPKCNQPTVLAGKNPQLEPPVAPPGERFNPPRNPNVRNPSEGSARSSGTTAPGKTSPGNTPPGKSPPVKPPAAQHHAPVNPPPTAAGPRAVNPARPSPAAPVSRPVLRAPQPPLPQLAGDDSIPLGCPHCNARMEPNDDLCNACGYHLILKKVIDISDMKQPSRTTGIERVLEGQLHESESGQSALLWAKIFASVVLVIFFFMCLGRWWWVGVLLTAAGATAYWQIHRRRVAQAAAEGSAVNQDPLASILWSMLLGVERIVGWRRLQWPFRPVKSLTLSDPAFHDDEITELTGLAELEAMDLEGTGVSDEGLRHLRELKQLRFLVVRRTKVTASGVQRLQGDLPKVMIWH